MTIKIRVGFEKELHEFQTRQHAFNWVRETQNSPCVVTVLMFNRGSLETSDRWHFDGSRFFRENITS